MAMVVTEKKQMVMHTHTHKKKTHKKQHMDPNTIYLDTNTIYLDTEFKYNFLISLEATSSA